MDLLSEIREICPPLECIFSSNDLIKFVSSKYIDLGDYHFGLGMWIRNNMLKEDSKLYNLFVEAGIFTKDNMSKIIIECFYLYEKTK